MKMIVTLSLIFASLSTFANQLADIEKVMAYCQGEISGETRELTIFIKKYVPNSQQATIIYKSLGKSERLEKLDTWLFQSAQIRFENDQYAQIEHPKLGNICIDLSEKTAQLDNGKMSCELLSLPSTR